MVFTFTSDWWPECTPVSRAVTEEVLTCELL